MNKLTKKESSIYGIVGIIQVVFIIVGIVTHDWFWLLTSYALNGNLYRVVNYQGEEV